MLLFLALSILGVTNGKHVTFYGSSSSPKVLLSVPTSDEWVASAQYESADSHVSNFAQLKIRSNEMYSDNEQMFAAGYVEGYLTAESIYQHYNNMLCQVRIFSIDFPE